MPFVKVKEQGTESAVGESPWPDKVTLTRERTELLVKWEAATGGRRSHLYTKGKFGKSKPIISKNQFYPWRDGELPPRATASVRLEAFLRETMDHNFRAP